MLFRADSWKAKTVEYLIAILLPVLCGINSGMSSGMSTTTGTTASWAHPGRSLLHTQKLSEVHLIYHQDFPYLKSHHYQPTPECVLLREKTKRQKKKTHVLRCTEHINLLLPATQANSWSKEQEQQGYVNLHAKQLTAEYVNPTIHAHIVLIKPAAITEKTSHGTSGYPATVLFIRHAHNVRTYRFKNLQTGTISTMNSTDNHPFYSIGKRAFISIDSVSGSDRLITETGQPVRLICSKKNTNHCGIPYRNNQLTTVYNLETYPKHTYFAGGKNHILVHNCSYSERGPLTMSYQADGEIATSLPQLSEENTMHFKALGDQMVTDPITKKSLPKKQCLRLVVSKEEPEREQAQKIEDNIWYSIAGIHTFKPDEQRIYLISPDTKTKITHVKNFYGTEMLISQVSITMRDTEGRLLLNKKIFPENVTPQQASTPPRVAHEVKVPFQHCVEVVLFILSHFMGMH